MIVRLAANAAIHTAGGVAMGIGTVLAACTLAQVATVALRRSGMTGSRSGLTPAARPATPATTDAEAAAGQPS